MSFIQYLSEVRGIDNGTSGSAGVVYAAVSGIPDINYRTAAEITAGVPVIRDTFERLWYEYEDYLDRQNYEREHSEPVPVYEVTGAILADIYQRKFR